MQLKELLKTALSQLRQSHNLLILSSTPILLLILLLSAISRRYVQPVMEFYSNLSASSKLDMDLVEGIINLRDLLSGSYTPFIFYGLLILLVCLLIHTMNIYGILTLNATSKTSNLIQLGQASFYYFPKVLLGTLLKWSLILSCLFFLNKFGLSMLVLFLIGSFLWFLLRFSNTFQIVDAPLIPSYLLSIKSVLGNPIPNLKLAFLLLAEIVIITALYGISIEFLVYFGSNGALLLSFLVTLMLIPAYLIWNFSNTIAFVLHYQEK